ncbi:hypothetical protein KSP39_PZI010913 [Platanthera zijinensis]|uniref:DUF4005 domain-containing protein n=1 Tax=Platanthera zijinensis TaxID=2320716 RepID=A0AAP0BHD6_9ASPA
MGRATRWLRSLFGGRKERKDQSIDNPREKRRWRFKSGRDSFETAGRIPPAEMKWLRSLYSEAQNEQSKHAIAVAAATAAAADAAVAAAEAAVAVVRLTRHGAGIPFRSLDERLGAAIKIQAFFRGYLAKKALRALKALVKLQALVRGYLIRKRAATTLHCMEALVRAQATVRAQKSKSLLPPRLSHSQETFDDENRIEHTPSFHGSSLDWSPKIVEIDTARPSLESRRNHRSYMSNTRAFEAKVRWQSVPKQRPEQSGSRKRVPLGEVAVEQSRASLSCVGVQRSYSQDENLSFGGELRGRKLDDGSQGFYLRRRW